MPPCSQQCQWELHPAQIKRCLPAPALRPRARYGEKEQTPTVKKSLLEASAEQKVSASTLKPQLPAELPRVMRLVRNHMAGIKITPGVAVGTFRGLIFFLIFFFPGDSGK